MKTLFGTTALVMALALPAMAQDAVTPFLPGIDRGVRASDFISKRVYITEQDTSAMSGEAIAAANTDWEDAGEISDVIISLNGDTEAVLVDFGGFLGIGEKTVAVSMANLVMVPDTNSPDDYFIVFTGSKAALESAPIFDEAMVFEATTTEAVTTTETAPAATDTMAATTTETAPAATDTMAATTTTEGTVATDPAATAPMTEGMVDYSTMTEADLIGKRVYGPNNEDVGEISAVTLAEDGKIAAAVVDVGGFIGIGEKPVALGAEMLKLVPDAEGDDQIFRVSMTQEQLEALPTYQK